MAQLRTALRAYAVEGHSPGLVVERVNELMLQLGPTSMTTLAYAVLNSAEESLELVSAGHPPPLLIDPSGEGRFLETSGGITLGASRTARYAPERFPMPTGSILFMFTDGLVETRGESIDVGLERLRVTATGKRGVEDLCRRIVERMVPDAPGDDVAFLAVRVPPLEDHMRTAWPAVPESLASVRYLLRRWLRDRGAREEEAYDITVACQEACANAIEHAYSPGAAGFELDLDFEAGQVRLTIRDRGHWRAPRGENRGRGLPMMRALMHEVDLRNANGGTEVVLSRTLGEEVAA
jgi:anti-sigma regulatory factor (Ser/Thr protein kinase)